MASIRISELRPAGSELFQDSESFLNELSDNREIDQVLGGGGHGGIFTNGNSVIISVNNTNNNGLSIANTNGNTKNNTYGNTKGGWGW